MPPPGYPRGARAKDYPRSLPLPRYRRCYELASGDMASVRVAFPEGAEGPGDAVSLQDVHPRLAAQEAFVEKFLEEASRAGEIDHPNVARVLDYGARDGGCFLVMELVHGCSIDALSKHLPRRMHAPDVAALAAYVVAAAADGSHAARMAAEKRKGPRRAVHAALTPADITVGYDGCIQVVGVGVASSRTRLRSTDTGITRLGYTTPEQLMGSSVDGRADVWSLGVILFELLSGRALFAQADTTGTALAITSHSRVPLALLPENLPRELIEVLDRALEPHPEDRYETSADLAADLRRAMRRMAHFDGADLAAWMHALFPGKAAEEDERVRSAWAGT